MPILPGRIDPPFWWRPWIPLAEWWQRPRRVKVPLRRYPGRGA